MDNIHVFLIICLVLVSEHVYCANLTNLKELYKDIFSDYTKQVMPMANTSVSLSVGIVFHLISLNDFKEVDETLSLLGVFGLNWTDPSLEWNPVLYGNLSSAVIKPSDLWLPPTFLINRADSMKPIGHDIEFEASIIYTGDVYYSPGGILEAKCPTDISKFPFDTQECKLEILPWGIGETHMKYNSYLKEVGLSWYTQNSNWKLLEYTTSVETRTNIHLFTVKLKMKREPLYYTVMIILPTILFAVLNPFVFSLPVESGERVSFAITILLSYAIFLTLVSASIPASSNPMCILLIVMIVIISISGIITYGAIISAKYFYEKDQDDFWSPLEQFAKWRLKRKRNIVNPVDCTKEIDVTGKDISDGLDFLFFYGSFIAVFVISIAYFIAVFV